MATGKEEYYYLAGNLLRSYLDKLNLGKYLPYDFNIFIDSYCLAFGDLNLLFDYFENADVFPVSEERCLWTTKLVGLSMKILGSFRSVNAGPTGFFRKHPYLAV